MRAKSEYETTPKDDVIRNTETRTSDDMIHIKHILAAMEQIDRYTRGMSESEFLSRTMVQDAVIRQIELSSGKPPVVFPLSFGMSTPSYNGQAWQTFEKRSFLKASTLTL